MLNEQGFVAECTGDNLFVVRDGEIATPPVSAGSLDGITRTVVIRIAKELGIPVRETNLTRYDIIAADECYLTFDIDVVDPAFAPGTGTPSVGGFSSSGVFEALRMLAGVNLVGADVVEVLPDRDPSGITSLLAAHVIFEILSLDALRRTV